MAGLLYSTIGGIFLVGAGFSGDIRPFTSVKHTHAELDEAPGGSNLEAKVASKVCKCARDLWRQNGLPGARSGKGEVAA